MRGFAAIVRKDLRLELRRGESTVTLVALSLLILVVMVFALDPAGGARDARTAAGALWVALIFAGMLGATRTLAAERENGCIRGLLLSPVDPAAIYAAKLAAAFMFMTVAEIAATFIMVVFFNLEFDARLARLAPILLLGTLGFAAMATLLAAITTGIRAGDLLMPLLAVPLFVPALIAGVKASSAALAGEPFAAFTMWINVLGAFDVLFACSGYLMFEHVVAEE